MLCWLMNLGFGGSGAEPTEITTGIRRYAAKVPVTKYQAQTKNNRYTPQ